jgi:hypothetical protein
MKSGSYGMDNTFKWNDNLTGHGSIGYISWEKIPLYLESAC